MRTRTNRFLITKVSQSPRLAFTLVARLVEFFIRRLSVEGSSMVPTYLPGERLTALRRWRPVRVGDVVVVRDPREPSRWLLKRCVAREGSSLDLRGDNRGASTDSRDFGLVARREVVWLVLKQRS
ncbi:MAG: S26 family signal peptidase [Acidimicrobiales bacterium]